MPDQLDLLTYLPPGTKLRPYQADTLKKALESLRLGFHPVLSLPTGSGKSVVLAALCDALGGRILVATHRQELLEQDASQLEAYGNGGTDFGIYSAGLGRRDDQARVIFGGIASIYRRMEQLQAAGPFAYVIVDEAHRCPPPSIPSMYGTVFRACPTAQRIGLTATPYRFDDGLLHEGGDAWFTSMPVHVGIRELTPAYLAPLVGVMTAHDVDVSQVRTRMGEFNQGDLSQAACEEAAVKGALQEILVLARERRKWLIFAVDVAHTSLVTYALQQKGITCKMVTGETPKDERRELLQDFRDGTFQAMANCEVMTVGMDIPDIDCVILLRPTQSKGLCVQMLGRGTRQAPGKSSCLVLDFSGNLERHAPLDELYAVEKSAPRQALDAKKASDAARAERQAKDRLAKHQERASLVDPMGTTTQEKTPQRYEVLRMFYKILPVKRFPGKKMLMAIYACRHNGTMKNITHFVCLEHDGWARQQSVLWFLRRYRPAPNNALEALRQAYTYPMPTHVLVRQEGRWARILREDFEEESQ